MKIIKTYGPPGTGKTTRLIERIAQEHAAGVAYSDMAYLSFSVAAKDVIRDRLQLTKKDMKWFRTIHSASAFDIGVTGSTIRPRHYHEFKKLTGMKITPEDFDGDFRTRGTDFNMAMRAYQLSLTTMRPLKDVVRELPQHPNLQDARLNNFIEAWEKFKFDRKLFDFTDMLTWYAREGAPLPVKVGILDEAQDLSELQWVCVERMFANVERFYMAGDDDQAIYPFIGASEYGFLDHPCDEEEVLTKSYRVPKVIGAQADRIIGRVKHRKEKIVEWKDAPGSVSRVNRDAMSMNWRKLQEQFPRTEDGPGIMILCRHRAGAHNFSVDLRLRGVAHSLHGETMNTWPEAKILHSIYALRDGKSITSKAACDLAEALGRDTSKYRDMGKRERVGAMEGVNLRTIDFLAVFGSDKKARSRYNSLLRLIKEEGYEALIGQPSITISTMHGSKGKEAPLVIIMPDCTNIVKQNTNTATERRLSYVAMTRAMQEVRLISPRTGIYINHFFQ